MKSKFVSFSVSIIALMMLGACSTSNVENLMTEVDEATQQNRTLESAAYEQHFTMQPGGLEQTAEGLFVLLENGEYNWSHKEYLGEGQNFAQTAEIDGWQYELYSVDEPGFDPEWKKVEGETLDVFDRIYPLVENTIEEEYLDEVHVTAENGKTYKITLTDAYLEDSIAETIQDLEESKAEWEEAGDGVSYAQALEEHINRLQEMAFSDAKLELVINGEGYLTTYASSYTVTTPEEEPLTTIIRYELTDYNLEDAASLLPDIE